MSNEKMEKSSSEYDVEKHGVTNEIGLVTDETGAVHASAFEQGDGWYAKLQRLAGRFNIEQRGIERVPEDERTDIHGLRNVGTMVCHSLQ